MRTARKKGLLLTLIAAMALMTTLAASPVFGGRGPPGGEPADGQIIPGQFIVLVDGAHDPRAVAESNGVPPGHVFRTAVNGFSGPATNAQVAALRADDRVLAVENDRIWRHDEHCDGAQCLPTGINRIETDKNPGAAIDGTHVEIDLDIAIIDSGIDEDHPDLNVAGGYNATSGPADKWDDKGGHGTHTAGTAAAIDNGTGVVGVAPGARLWAIKVCKNGCFLSDMIAGVNWVAERKSEANNGDADGDPGIDFAVASMSISHEREGTPCDDENSTSLHLAFCGLVATGVVATLSAGNTPELNPDYPEVIQVAAMADFDGKGGAASTDTICGSNDGDDTLADFSTFGADIAAPGSCILSTYNNGGLAYASGTSMAAPHVGGAVALYLHANGFAPATDEAGVNAIEAAIIGAALVEGTDPLALGGGDVCSYDNQRGTSEPMLFVNGATFGGDGSCDVAGGGGGNAAPDAVSDGAAVDEGSSTAVLVLANDSDPEGDPLAIASVSTPSNGTATINDNGTATDTTDDFIDYSHDGSETTSDSFSYTISDGSLTDTAIVSVTVNAVNDGPTAVDDSYGTNENIALIVDPPGVLDNDTDPDSTTLTASLVADSGPSSGTLDFNSNGSFSYTPNTDFVGDDTFKYTASDGFESSNEATVTITVSEPSSAMHVSDLDEDSTRLQKGAWSAQVTIEVHDANDAPVIGAEVEGTFTQNGDTIGPLFCTTDSIGRCTIDSDQLPNNSGSATFTVDSVTDTLVYDATANHDDEADSDGTTIVVSK